MNKNILMAPSASPPPNWLGALMDNHHVARAITSKITGEETATIGDVLDLTVTKKEIVIEWWKSNYWHVRRFSLSDPDCIPKAKELWERLEKELLGEMCD